MNKSFAYSSLALALALVTAAAATAKDAEVPKAKPVAEAASAEAKPATPARSKPQVRPLSVTADLLSGTKIVGTLTDASTLDMQTSFGNANIPLSEVAGIRFASADDVTTTVVMHNGDSITGATDVKLVTIETEWGIATINGQSVRSITFVPDVQWNPLSGLSGKRWSLISEKQAAAAKPAAKPAQPQAPTHQPVRTTTGYPTSQPYYGGR